MLDEQHSMSLRCLLAETVRPGTAAPGWDEAQSVVGPVQCARSLVPLRHCSGPEYLSECCLRALRPGRSSTLTLQEVPAQPVRAGMIRLRLPPLLRHRWPPSTRAHHHAARPVASKCPCLPQLFHSHSRFQLPARVQHPPILRDSFHVAQPNLLACLPREFPAEHVFQVWVPLKARGLTSPLPSPAPHLFRPF
jgi:hypothetical protein